MSDRLNEIEERVHAVQAEWADRFGEEIAVRLTRLAADIALDRELSLEEARELVFGARPPTGGPAP